MSKRSEYTEKDFSKNTVEYRNHFRGITLSKKIVLLISIVVLLALIPSSIFTITRISQIVYDRVSINAVSINTILCNSEEIKKGLIQQNRSVDPVIDNFMFEYVNDVDNSDEAGVAIFDKNLQLRVYYNPGNLINFRQNALEIVQKYSKTNSISWHDNYKIPHKAFGYVYNADNDVIGYVVTGYPANIFNASTMDSIIFMIMTSFFGLMAGIAGAIFLADHIKRVLFGLEPEEIAALLKERNIILNSVREGVININSDGIITLINTEAFNLLEQAQIKNVNNMVGKKLKNIFPYTNVKLNDVIEKGTILADVSVKLGTTIFIFTAVPLKLGDSIIGAVITFRKKSVVEEMANQITGFQNYVTALRAQTHEFMNKMHVIMGLIDIQAYDKLKEYTQEIAYNRQSEVSYITTRLNDITLAGFILAKISRSRELDIDFALSEESELHSDLEVPSVHDLVLIIGNIVENAFDALKNFDGERIVNLTILDFDKEIVIEVEDSGPGMDQQTIDNLFVRGFTSKGEPGHGFGMYLVKQSVDNLNGTISIESEVNQGTIFTVRLPVNKEGEKND